MSAEDLPRILPENVPDSPGQAIGIVAELKGNAALFAAFAFGSLNLPSPLIISESKATSLGGGVTTSRPIPDSDLLQAFVTLDALTLCLMITCVAASQLLIYRLADGSYGTIKYSTEDYIDPRDTPTGRLTTQYRAEFRIARAAFALGLGSLLIAVAIRSLAVFDEGIALPVVALVGASAVSISSFYVSSYLSVFRPLDVQNDASTSNATAYRMPWLTPAVVGAGLAVFIFMSTVHHDQLQSESKGMSLGSFLTSLTSSARSGSPDASGSASSTASECGVIESVIDPSDC